MFGGPVRTLLLGAMALGGTVLPAAGHGAHHHGRGYSSYHRGYPYFYYGPAYAPGIAFGVSHYPVAVGFALPLGPKDPRGSLKTLVDPRDTEVFIDRYYVGVVDDFDGSLQGLRLEPGPHAITLYREGFRLHEETVYSTLGATVKLRHEMVPLLPGEPIPSRPSPGGGASVSAPPAPAPPSSAATRATAPAAAVTGSDYGTLALRSSPPDAEIWIDGERWHLPPGSDRFIVHLPAGRHAIELHKEGYEGYAAEIEILPGEASAMNVLLGAPLSP